MSPGQPEEAAKNAYQLVDWGSSGFFEASARKTLST